MPIRLLRNLLGRGGDAPNASAVTAAPSASVPDGLRVYAIGDVHGRLDLLLDLERRITADLAAQKPDRALAIYLGDLIDRGPNSKGVISHLIGANADGLQRRFLRGNHEETMLQFLDEPQVAESWRRYGGLETLHSYGVDVRDVMRGEGADEAQESLRAKLPDDHLEFLLKTEPMLVVGDYCFVHAGVKPGVPIERQTEEHLFWIRDEFMNFEGDFGKVVVHGHTPVPEPQRLPNRISVDTGAYMTSKLTAAVLEGSQVRFLSTGFG